MRVASRVNIAVLALLVGSCLAAHHSVWGEEPHREASDTTTVGDDEPFVASDFAELFAIRDPGPDVKMRTYDFNIGDESTSDTTKRRYSFVCRERLLEMQKNPGPPVEFTFDFNSEDETPPQPNPVRQALGSFLNSVRKKPAASELIAGKIDDAILQARVDEQIKGFDLYMEVENGRVILEGDVVSVEQQRRVKKIVKSIPEVRRLVYRVTVRQPEM